MINESFINEMQSHDDTVFTGEQIADMVGMGDVYRQGKSQIENEKVMSENVTKNFSTLMERLNNVPKTGNALID